MTSTGPPLHAPHVVAGLYFFRRQLAPRLGDPMASIVVTCFKCLGRWLCEDLGPAEITEMQKIEHAGLKMACDGCWTRATDAERTEWIVVGKLYGTIPLDNPKITQISGIQKS